MGFSLKIVGATGHQLNFVLARFHNGQCTLPKHWPMSAWSKATRVLGTHGTMEVEEQWRISGHGTKRRDRIQDVTPIEDKPNTLHHMANWLDCVLRRDAVGLNCPARAGYGHSIACIMTTEARCGVASLWSLIQRNETSKRASDRGLG